MPLVPCPLVRRRPWLALALLVGGAGLAAPIAAQHDGVAPAVAPPPAIDYARDVRPILAQHCYTCHGPDEQKRKADLRLDRRDAAFAARDGGAAFVAGDPDGSVALQRIVSSDPDEHMPPPDAGDALKPAEVATLRAWLAAGAPWSEHWAFVPPQRPTPPAVRDAAWLQGDLDRFVLARLEQEGLRPSAPADRAAWLRRVTFDLIGLPPTPAELDEFAKDQRPEAFAAVVDRLLADPRYGERMASDWLDVARYADSSGYQRDTPRQAWKWRDWVIDALNANMPFDRFTVEQLAGDLLPNPTLAQRIATGFNRNHPVNTEAGEELDEYRSAYVIDRVHTTATAWLGLSVGCAQCHDHKYDPISQREFYRFYDFFNHVKEKDNGFGRNPKPAIPAPGPDDEVKLADLRRRIDVLKRRLDRDDPLADEGQRQWEAAAIARLGAPLAWTVMTPSERMARHGSRLQQLDDGSILATGPTPARDTYELVFVPGKRTIHALRLEALPDPSLPHGASGRADDGRFILGKVEARLCSVAESSDPPPIVFALAQADVNQKPDEDEHYLTAIAPGPVAGAVGIAEERDGDEDEDLMFGFGFGGWTVAGDERKQPREAVLIPSEPLVCNENTLLRVSLTMGSAAKFKSLLGRFRVTATDEPRVRTLLLPLQPSTWQALGPFPAADVDAAFAAAFAPEQDLATAQWKKKYDQPALPKPAPAKDDKAATKDGKGAAPTGEPAAAGKPPAAAAAAAAPAAAGAAADPGGGAPDAAGGDAAGGVEAEAGDGATKPSPKQKRLQWQEHRDWRDGRAARLPVDGPASAWYVARKVRCETARTMVLELDGGAAAKVWLNGSIAAEYEAPAEPTPEAAAAKQKAMQAKQKAAAADGDFFAMRFGEDEREPRRLRLGLRAGDNYVVIKLVGKGRAGGKAGKPGPGSDDVPPEAAFAMAAMGAGGDDGDADDDGADGFADGMPSFGGMGGRGGGGGLSFTCRFRAEGDDLLDYATMQALRAAPAAAAAAGVAAAEASAPQPAAGATPAATAPKTPAERRTAAVRRWYRTRIDVVGRVLFDELVRLLREQRRFEATLPSALVMEELKTPRTTHVFVRGDYRKKGDVVTAGTPAALPPMTADLPKNRLGLARWLVSPDHPLTARVAVNRAWQQFFGLGLVRTADDFGVRGAPPSHPELLDWLATEFVRTGWDVKRLHKAIVLSATYRQASALAPELLAKDPDNVLLARGPRQRLSAEMLRDQALAAAGILVPKVGGPSVKPFQPAGLWRAMLGGSDWRNDSGDATHRRALYTYWKRGVPYPSAMVYDASKRETCAVTRTRTTTPLQALVTLNDPVFVEAGRALGQRLRKEGGADDDARLTHGFRLVASRAPDAEELSILRGLLADQRKHYAAKPDLAKALLGIVEPKGKGKAGKGGDAPAKAGDAVAAGAPAAPAAGAGEPAGNNAVAPPLAATAGSAGAAADAPPSAPVPAGGNAATAPSTAATAKPREALDPKLDPAEAAAWAQIGCTLLNLEAAIRRG
ncbi:MAG: DUF1553 domain-containing protein [Planctomycetota bacterium]